MSSGSKKRKIPSGDFHNSSYFKIRSIVRDLRPAFLQAIHAADFRNCKAASDIRKKMKMILELHRQLRLETAPPTSAEKQSSVGVHSQAKADHQEKDVNTKTEPSPPPPTSTPAQQVDAHQVKEGDKEQKQSPAQVVDTTPETKVVTKTKDSGEQLQGTKASYVIGGSPIGWNFVVCSSGESAYYGLTKEAWRAKQAASS